MRLVIAYLRPSALEPAIRAVVAAGGQGMAYAEVRGYGRQKEHLDSYRPGVLGYAFLPRVRLTYTVSEHALENSLSALQAVARTGGIGDGKIFVIEGATPDEVCG